MEMILTLFFFSIGAHFLSFRMCIYETVFAFYEKFTVLRGSELNSLTKTKKGMSFVKMGFENHFQKKSRIFFGHG